MFEACSTSTNILDTWFAKFIYFMNEGFFLNPVVKNCDMLGLNFYFTTRFLNLKTANPDDFNSDLGWWIYPQGIKNILLKLKRYNKPIYITENGVADAKDKHRKRFIHDMLIKCGEAINEGVDLRGYFYWSLIDNFEWHQGFWPRFGIVEIDREHDLKRKPRKSFSYYAEICKNNAID